jgi:Plant transposon protein
MAWHGHFKGKEKAPSFLVLKTYANYNLWILHSTFGYAGTLIDIDIWEHSPLLKSFLDGIFSQFVDFEYNIGGETLTQLWLLVDNIYPEVSRFVKTIDEPIDACKQWYARWQEFL